MAAADFTHNNAHNNADVQKKAQEVLKEARTLTCHQVNSRKLLIDAVGRGVRKLFSARGGFGNQRVKFPKKTIQKIPV